MVEIVVEGIGGAITGELQGNIRNSMTPGVSGLEGQPVREAAVDPNLECMVAGIARGLRHENVSNTHQSAMSINQGTRIGIISSNGLSNCGLSAGNNIIP